MRITCLKINQISIMSTKYFSYFSSSLIIRYTLPKNIQKYIDKNYSWIKPSSLIGIIKTYPLIVELQSLFGRQLKKNNKSDLWDQQWYLYLTKMIVWDKESIIYLFGPILCLTMSGQARLLDSLTIQIYRL